MSRRNNINIIKRMGWFDALCGASATALALAGLVILNPHVVEETNAESAVIPVEITSEAYLRLTLSGGEGGKMAVSPDIDGSFIESPDITLNVSTNNPTGYKLVMATEDGTSALTNTANKDTIPSIGGKVSAATFPLNHWGYNLTSSSIVSEDYHGVPGSNLTLDNQRTSTENYTLNFAAKLDASKNGTYSNTVVISAVANPLELITLNNITKMQEMTPQVCDDTPVDATKQLQDTRDSKWYWVTKLRDGNCWMTQNLDLDLNSSTLPLTSATSDVTSNWSPEYETITDNNFDPTAGATYTASYSWDIGDYMLTDSIANSTSCDDIMSGTIPINQNCAALTAYDNAVEHAHYLTGNYYQFATATAGTAAAEAGKASSSICPKNWTLPDNEGDNSYGNLIDIYKPNNVQDATSNTALNAPFYFVFAGYVNPERDQRNIDGINSSGYYQSNTSESRSFNYYFSFNRTYLNSSASFHRYFGFPVRCVAR